MVDLVHEITAETVIRDSESQTDAPTCTTHDREHPFFVSNVQHFPLVIPASVSTPEREKPAKNLPAGHLAQPSSPKLKFSSWQSTHTSGTSFGLQHLPISI